MLAASLDTPVPTTAEVLGQLLESLYLTDKLTGNLALGADSPVSVGFGSIVNASVIILRSTSKVRARITSADGSTQSVPVDPLFVLLAGSVPVTAIDLTRLAGVNTNVTLFLGER